jgi:hypothetical protein
MSSTVWARKNTRLARRDENEPDIVKALRAFGASVEFIGRKGVPDLLVGFKGEDFKLEVKMPGKPLRDEQEVWHSTWRGRKPVVVENPEQALRAIGALS